MKKKIIVRFFLTYVLITLLAELCFIIYFELADVNNSYQYLGLYLLGLYLFGIHLMLFLIFLYLFKNKMEARLGKIIPLLIFASIIFCVLNLTSNIQIFSSMMWITLLIALDIYCLYRFIKPIVRHINGPSLKS